MKQRAALLLCLAVASACGTSEVDREARQQELASRVRVAPDGAIVLTPEEQEALHVETDRASPGEVAAQETVYGVVRAAPGIEVEVTAPMTAIVDGPPLVVLGERVGVGEPLVRLLPSLDTGERTSLAMRRQELEGQIIELEHRVEQQDAAAERARNLYEQGIESLAGLEAAEADATGWRARLAAARAELSSLEVGTAEPFTVSARTAGTVAAVDVEAGVTVRQGERLLTLLGTGGRRVDVGLDPKSPPVNGFSVLVGSRWVPARRVGRSGVVGADGLRHELFEVDADDAGLEPGATVLVRLGEGAATGVVLPASAVVPAAGGDVAFVADEPGHYRLCRLHVIERADDRVVVDRGVRSGERVVTRGAMELWGEVVKAGATGEADGTAHPR